MMIHYLTLLADIPIIVIMVAIGAIWKRPESYRWIVAAILYVTLDSVVTIVTPNLFHLHWNWTGKLASVLFGLLTTGVLRLRRDEVGLVLPVQGRSLYQALGWALFAIAISCTVNFIVRDHKAPSREKIAFESTMPGLSEELAFRGVFLALMLRAYKDRSGRAEFFIAASSSTAIFGIGHGLIYNGESFHLLWLPLCYSAALGAILVVVRRLSGSIFPAIVAHNATNVCGDFASWL